MSLFRRRRATDPAGAAVAAVPRTEREPLRPQLPELPPEVAPEEEPHYEPFPEPGYEPAEDPRYEPGPPVPEYEPFPEPGYEPPHDPGLSGPRGSSPATSGGEPAAGDLAAGLEKSRGGFMSRLRGLLLGGQPDGPSWAEVEETLIAGDVGALLAMRIVERARARRDPAGPEAAVRAELEALLVPSDPHWSPSPAVAGQPVVVLVVGVNGTGKTTTIGKLAHRYRAEGRSVLIAAADTFRAAAIEQLEVWARRAGATIVAHAPGADPGAVVYDALDAAVARRIDVVIADTAGRLHTKAGLMDELTKIRRVIDRRLPGARPEVLFVLDATTGQNGLAQAKAFHEAVGLTGIVLTKLDSTARGGIVFAIEDALGLPVRYVGVGEQVADLLPFDPHAFVTALFA
ncbi:MAG: signal recognition particle-docking protein FtsY [Chloroflexota bacterium]